MDKKTQNMLMIGGGLALLYYLYTRGDIGVSAANQETPDELLASTNATIAGQEATMFQSS